MTNNVLNQEGIRELGPEEAKVWQQRIVDNVDASPLPFECADEATAPFIIEVTNGQSPEGKTLIIHLIKRADLHPDRAIEVARHALVDVFGPDAGTQAECDYRNVAELKKKLGDEQMISEAHDSLTIIFPTSSIVYTRSRAWVRDQMAMALRRWYDKSLSW